MKKKTIPKALRRQVIERDKKTCQYCGKKAEYWEYNGGGILNLYMKRPHHINQRSWDWYDTEPFEIDHVIPEFLGGEMTIENLKLSCRYCNRSKGWRENG